MPQKPIFTRYPVLSLNHAFLSNGQIRTQDERVIKLYQAAQGFLEKPETWEGIFGLACLICNHPEEEKVSALIYHSLQETDDGSFEGTIEEQICRARASFAVFEYNTDKKILQRLSQWFRYLEINWEELTTHAGFLIQPADLMELLIRFYQVTGIKSVLRICSRLRSSSFDWTTALHTFQQSIPVHSYDQNSFQRLSRKSPPEIDYDEKQMLTNHAVYLADGFRYSLYAGLFSGNRQDLSAGETAWKYLKKHHRAVCGGTTSDPLLCGCGSDKAVSNIAIAAWTEAFASQMLTDHSEWAANELIRIIFNGLSDCLNREWIPGRQYVNTLNTKTVTTDDSIPIYARMTRAVTAAYRHAVMMMTNGVRINYFLPCRMLLMLQKQSVVFCFNDHQVVFQSKCPFFSKIELFVPVTETAELFTDCNHTSIATDIPQNSLESWGTVICSEREWRSQEGFHFLQGERIYTEPTHHQGKSFFVRNRLMSLPADENDFRFAVNGEAEISMGRTELPVCRVKCWNLYGGDIPADIPVLPETDGLPVQSILSPYDETPGRITVFPTGRKNV